MEKEGKHVLLFPQPHPLPHPQKNDKTLTRRRSVCLKNKNSVKLDGFVKHVDPTAPRTI